MKIDVLAISAHPDDAELSSSGTLISEVQNGRKVGILDLTLGELGTRGDKQLRKEESKNAAEIVGASFRDNLELEDGFFKNDKENQLKVIQRIRKFRPNTIITNSIYDRHPDHVRGAQLVEESYFKAGLRKIDTFNEDGTPQDPWRPKHLLFMIQSISLQPTLIIDISSSFPKKMEAIRAFKSQFFNPDSKEPETYISTPGFMAMLESRAVEYGHQIGVGYGEGFQLKQTPGLSSICDLL